MEFIYADTLKEKFDVLGHFYDLRIGHEIFKCRSSLEIVSKQNRKPSNEAADAVVIMMNPGSSVYHGIKIIPLYSSPSMRFFRVIGKRKLFSLDQIMPNIK